MDTTARALALVPSENWDDDFEFQSPRRSSLGQRTRTHSHTHTSTGMNSHHHRSKSSSDASDYPLAFDLDFNPPLPSSATETRMSTASSHFSEDWDAETAQASPPTMHLHQHLESPTTPSKSDYNRMDTSSNASSVAPLSFIAAHTHARGSPTENWDDDFAEDSPRRLYATATTTTTTPSKKGKERKSWDEEFAFESLAPEDALIDSDEEDDEEFGIRGGRVVDDEEDRTVTARSRRAALKRSSPSPSPMKTKKPGSSPPPPVPALPSVFGGPGESGGGGGGGLFKAGAGAGSSSTALSASRLSLSSLHPPPHQHQNQPNSSPHSHSSPLTPFLTPHHPHAYPHTLGPAPSPTLPQQRSRSPSSSISVFSVPTSIGAESSYSLGSTAPLRGSFSRVTSNPSNKRGIGNGFKGLPPSPPIHKERERRRLKKKSRPSGGGGVGVFELRDLDGRGTGRGSLDAERERERERWSFDAERDGGAGGFRFGDEEDVVVEGGRERGIEECVFEDDEAMASGAAGEGVLDSRVAFTLPAPTAPPPPIPAPPALPLPPPALTPTPPLQLATPQPPRNISNSSSTTTTTTAASSSSSAHPQSSEPTTPPPAPTTTTSLLSRIGSVKKRWGVRRKSGVPAPAPVDGPARREGEGEGEARVGEGEVGNGNANANGNGYRTKGSSVAPSEAPLHEDDDDDDEGLREAEAEMEMEMRRPRPGNLDSTQAPRPTSSASASSNQYSSYSSHQNQNPRLGQASPLPHQQQQQQQHLSSWFFRGSSSGSPSSRLGGGGGGGSSMGSHSGSMTDLSQRVVGVAAPPTPATPTKLMKRKSFGFVQLRRGFSESPQHPQPPQTPGKGRHASYAGGATPSRGRNNAMSSGDDFSEQEQERDRKVSFSKARDPFLVSAGEDEKKLKEGSRGILGSVRKISLVGRHKRTKSGGPLAPLPSVAILEDRDQTPRRGSVDNRRLSYEDRRPKTPSRTAAAAAGSLLPPIELQPPSPQPKLSSSASSSDAQIESMLSPVPSTSTSSGFGTPRTASGKSPKRSLKTPGSPQSASLGRTTIGMVAGSSPSNGSASGNAGVPRRNSLGDLKIPARISQAQVGLRRDLGMVREFAANVEQLKDLQSTYHGLLSEVQRIMDAKAHLHSQLSLERAASPPLVVKKSKTRKRSYTNPTPSTPSTSHLAYKEFVSTFYTINSKYRISWECAELLIELGGGRSSASTPASAPPASAAVEPSLTKARERAITLAGDESKPSTPTASSTLPVAAVIPAPPTASPPALSWRASTGRNDLSHRQLVLLREMLNNAEHSQDGNHAPIVEESTASLPVNRDWRWGDPMSSTLTLPSTENGEHGGDGIIPTKKRQSSRLGMAGIRDMLRSLKKSHIPPPVPNPTLSPSSASLTTDSSVDGHQRPAQSKRRVKSSTGPEPAPTREGRSKSPYHLSAKASPRRPSLSSIFRLGQRSKVPAVPSSNVGDSSGSSAPGNRSSFQESSSTGEEEDWDRMDSASDLDAAAKALGLKNDQLATVRGKRIRSPYMQFEAESGGSTTPKRTASSSQSSIWGGSSSNLGHSSRTVRLSNVEEQPHDEPQLPDPKRRSRPRASPSRPPSSSSRTPKTGSVRSMPPQSSIQDLKLAMTPENIKPLLNNSKEVQIRLSECISEIKTLLRAHQ